ncbi:MAG TPA: glycosyltransferase [Flavobacteriales bacterium]|nr:glycosyltransferase [Flavobacteriales bacterium]HMR27404.1 glycosyltransferase [Flavobacteriales bacterium]
MEEDVREKRQKARAARTRTAPLRLMYATSMDPTDVRAWSGTVRFIAKSLEDQQVRMRYLGELQRTRVLLRKAVNKVQHWISPDSIFPVERTTSMARRFAGQIADALAESDCDVIFSPSSIPVALLQCDRPKVFYTDATFAGILELYPEYRNYPRRYLKQGHDLEREALRSCDLAIYSSEWAARTAVEHYDADPTRIRVVPFGCNLDRIPARTRIEQVIDTRPMERCELLFLAVSWERKGGDIALRTAEALHARGLSVRLTIVGCTPPDAKLPAFVEVVPFIAKSTPAGQRRIANLIQRSHFLLLPTRADCSPIVFSECNAFGVPCITTAVGGTPSSVRDGVNGMALPLKADAADYAASIAALMLDPDGYRDLAHGALNEHHERLNWTSTGLTLRRHLEELLRSRG